MSRNFFAEAFFFFFCDYPRSLAAAPLMPFAYFFPQSVARQDSMRSSSFASREFRIWPHQVRVWQREGKRSQLFASCLHFRSNHSFVQLESVREFGKSSSKTAKHQSGVSVYVVKASSSICQKLQGHCVQAFRLIFQAIYSALRCKVFF